MTPNELLTLAHQIKIETVEEANSSLRVGFLLEEIIKYFRDNGGSGGGTSFIGEVITTAEQLNALITPGVYPVQMAAAYEDFDTANFDVLVMPMGNGANNFVQISFVFSQADEFSVKARWCAYAPPVLNAPAWNDWKTNSGTGGGGVGTETDPVFEAWLNTNPLANLALQSWVTENFALKESGIEPPLSETVQFTTGANTYTITDASAENITVQAIVAGSIDYGVLTADKAVKIINAGPAVITIDGTPVGAGVTAFAIFDFATADWTISTVIDPVVPNYSDITVDQYSTTGVVLSPIGYYKIAAHGMGGTTAGNLIFVNNAAQASAIGIYQALEGAGSGEIKAKKIATGIKLNVVRIKGGSVYHSEYDGANLASLKFSNITAKENIGVAAGLITQIIDGATDDTLKKLQDKITALQAIVGGSTPDGDSVVNTVTELLTIFSAFPEGVDIATVLASKVNATDVYNALDAVVSGKVLDARQGKVLNDAIATLSSLVISDYQKKTDNSLETNNKTIVTAINEVNTKATASKTTVTYTAAFTLSANDKGKVIIVNSASDMAITIPANLPANSVYEFWSKGAGIVSFVAGSGNVINSADSRLKIRGQYCGAYIYIETTNITQLSGDIVL